MFMREDENFRIETIKLNGHKVKVSVPIKTITLEEATRIQRRILGKYAKRSSSTRHKSAR